MVEPAPLHPISRQHLEAMTGELGIFQHARGSQPDPAHGHCVDDVARALEVDVLHARELGWPAVARSANRNLRFLEEAFDPETARFRNFRSIDGSWVDDPGSDDAQGRAMLALGESLGAPADAPFLARARKVFARALPGATTVSALRASASVLLGCDAAAAALAVAAGDEDGRPALERATVTAIRTIGTRLHDGFVATDPDWPWPERSLTYENALLPRALIVAGVRTGDAKMLATGLRVLDWLVDVQTSPGGQLSPVGNGWWPRGGERSRFDQQPIEATALIAAAEAAHAATGDPRYIAALELAYGWFLGANDLGLRIADPLRGASKDGLTRTGVNLNEGAESTLVWLIAAERVRRVRGRTARAHPTGPARVSAPARNGTTAQNFTPARVAAIPASPR